MNRKTVFFDLGNVILFFSHEKMCSQIAELCGLEQEAVKTYLFENKAGENYERGSISSKELYHFFCTCSKKNFMFEELMHAAGNIFEPNLEVFKIIEKLKENEHELILLSNTCEAHFLHAKRQFNILNLFDRFVLSYEVKTVKPEKAIFRHALSLSSSSLTNCFYVDDIQGHIAAAQELGLDAEVFTQAVELEQQLKKRAFL